MRRSRGVLSCPQTSELLRADMSSDCISCEQPKPGQSLVSFLTTAAADSALEWTAFQRHVLRGILRGARWGERRAFDWDRMASSLGIDPKVLFGMSERNGLTAIDDTRPIAPEVLFLRPWMCEKGYAAYDPVVLKERFYIHGAWLRPDALINVEHGTLILRQCHSCGSELAETKWQHAFPTCPGCDEPLSEGPIVKAPSRLLRFTDSFTKLVDRAYRAGITIPRTKEAEQLAGIYLCASALRKTPAHLPLIKEIGRRAELGVIECSGITSADQQAIFHIQSLAAAHHLWDHHPVVFRRFLVMLRNTAGWRRAENASNTLDKGLFHVLDELGLAKKI
jgi:hypothetical protein